MMDRGLVACVVFFGAVLSLGVDSTFQRNTAGTLSGLSIKSKGLGASNEVFRLRGGSGAPPPKPKTVPAAEAESPPPKPKQAPSKPKLVPVTGTSPPPPSLKTVPVTGTDPSPSMPKAKTVPATVPVTGTDPSPSMPKTVPVTGTSAPPLKAKTTVPVTGTDPSPSMPKTVPVTGTSAPPPKAKTVPVTVPVTGTDPSPSMPKTVPVTGTSAPPPKAKTVPASGTDFGSFVTRSTSYSSLDEAKVTAKLAGPTMTDEEQLTNIGKTGQTEAQPKPEALAIEQLDKELQEIQKEEDQQLRIVIVSSEVAPWSKSGGLADVASKLSIALSQKGHRVMTVSPAYKGNCEGAMPTDVRKTFTLYGNGHDVHYLHLWLPTDPTAKDETMGVDHIFVQNKNFERAGMYGDPGGHDYFDNLFRFALLSWAGVEAPLLLPKVAPFGEKVVFVANDWQTGLVPLLVTSHYRRWRVFGPARCLFVIHNMGYHGNFPNPQMYNYDLPDPRLTPKWSFCDLGLRDNAYYDMYKWIFPEQERGDGGVVDDGECAKLLLGAIRLADRVVTVSPSYKEEIMSDAGGWKLQHDTRARQDKLDGILNGIDTHEWDPMTDPLLPGHYNASDQSGKAICKAAVQKALGLHQNPDAPLLCFIGRLAPQKGIDVLESAFDWLMGGDCGQGVLGDAQLIMMGSGEQKYAEFMRAAEGRNKGRVCGYVGFSSEMEHKIIAGSDILIMPSRYEPCGLPQMYAQRYGTVPVVHATGGLKDSVTQYVTTEDGGAVGTGWKFGNCDANGLKWGLWEALRVYKKEPENWKALRRRCMQQDFSWSASADKYIQLFKWALMDPPAHQPWPFC